MKTLDIDNLFPLGFINKTHGFQGELSLAITDELAVSLDQLKSAFLFLQLNGLPVPFFVENIREKSGGVIVKFENVSDEAEAKKLVGKKVFSTSLNTAPAENDESTWSNLIGYEVIDSAFGSLGAILDIQELPMQFLATCKVNDREILFPLHEEIILQIDDINKKLEIDLPEGLLDVYLNDTDNN